MELSSKFLGLLKRLVFAVSLRILVMGSYSTNLSLSLAVLMIKSGRRLKIAEAAVTKKLTTTLVEEVVVTLEIIVLI